MNYIKSLIVNFGALAGIYFLTAIGNEYRFFTRQSAPDMSAARFLVSLVFLVTCTAFAVYYCPAAKDRRGKFGAMDQKKLAGYIKRSTVVLVLGDLIIFGLSVLNGVMVLFGSGGYFSTGLVMVTILVYAGLYIFAMKYFQPKGIYLKSKANHS